MSGQPLPVSAVVAFLREVLEGSEFFSDLWVVGEVSNYTRSQLGHRYFSLKDQSAVLRTVLFRDSMPGTHLKNGDRVLAHGRITIYAQRGDLQMVCDFIRPEGVGIQAARLQQLREKLEREGLFDVDRKRPLPRFPHRIGVVTSPTGAAIHDIRQVLARRWPLARPVFVPAVVQGEQAAAQVLDALAELARTPGLDFVIVARGGGSAEDLGAFNSEAVARAVFAFPVPVVSGVGHETDWTLTDLVADLRAPTPSAAVERSTPDAADVRRGLEALIRQGEGRLRARLGERLRMCEAGLGRVQRSAPDAARANRELAFLLASMRAGLDRNGHRQRVGIAELGARVAALDPRATLARGFAVVEKEGPPREAVRSVGAVRRDDRLAIHVSDGSFPAEAR